MYWKACRERAVIDVAESVVEGGAISANMQSSPTGVNAAGGRLEFS